MDFENFFWIIPLLYLLRRLLFGSRKKQKARKPATQAPRPALSQKDRDDLQEGLGEIGRALGLPADLFQEHGEKTPASPAPSRTPSAREEPDPLFSAAAGEMVAYDAWAEPVYESDARFAEEEAFEAEGRLPAPDPIHANLKNQGGENGDLTFLGDAQEEAESAEIPSPYVRPARAGHALRRLAATASLQEAVLLKEILDRPVSLRPGPRLPFKSI